MAKAQNSKPAICLFRSEREALCYRGFGFLNFDIGNCLEFRVSKLEFI